jgi:hypothetical protein
MTVNDVDVVVVGAGVSGLAAARSLESRSRFVTVLDKGRSVGGRLATRRLADARLDHGAQFFTQRAVEMEALVEELLDEEVATEWCKGFSGEDGHPRYVIPGGMNGLGKFLAEPLEDVRCEIEVTSLVQEDRGWVVKWDGGELRGGAVLLTAPVPQSLAIIDRSGIALNENVRAGLDAVTYDAAMAVLVVLDGPSGVPAPGGVQLTEGPFTWVGDNLAKGVSEISAITLHTDDVTATALWDDDPAEVLAELMDIGAEWFGDANVVASELKKWKYAAPTHCWPASYCTAVDGDWPLVLAGDAFEGPKIEGAYRSGLAAALRLNRSGVTSTSG